MATSFNANDIKKRLLEFTTIFAFSYNGQDCDVDPYSPSSFHMRCGNREKDAGSIDEVMNAPFFDGRSLAEIAGEITDVELEEESITPLNLDSWRFLVLQTKVLDDMSLTQKTIGIDSLNKLNPKECKYSELKDALNELL